MSQEEVAKSALALNNYLFQRGDSEGLKLFGSFLDKVNNTLLELRAKNRLIMNNGKDKDYI